MARARAWMKNVTAAQAINTQTGKENEGEGGEEEKEREEEAEEGRKLAGVERKRTPEEWEERVWSGWRCSRLPLASEPLDPTHEGASLAKPGGRSPGPGRSLQTQVH